MSRNKEALRIPAEQKQKTNLLKEKKNTTYYFIYSMSSNSLVEFIRSNMYIVYCDKRHTNKELWDIFVGDAQHT